MTGALEMLREVSANYRHEAPVRGALAVAEEAGEFVGAFRRWAGMARRPGTFEEMEHELADVVLAAFATAVSLEMDLESAIMRKGSIILERIEAARTIEELTGPNP